MSSRLDPNRVYSGMATEHTLKEVVKAVSAINLNVGDIVVGDISVQSDDVGTHTRLDTTNSAIGITNNKLDTINSTITNKHLNSSTDSILVNTISNFAVENGGNLANINAKTAPMTYHLDSNLDRLYVYDNIEHTKLDTINNTITNKHLDKTVDSVNIAGQTISVANLNTLARESTLSNINQNIPLLTTDNQDRLNINTEGQTLNIGNFPENQTINGSVSVSNFPTTQQIIGSVGVTNQITGFALDTSVVDVKNAINNKYLSSVNDSVLVSGTVGISNNITNYATQTTLSSVDTTLSSIKTNTDKNKYIGDDLKAVISNTGFNCNNQITGFALEAGNLANIKTNTDKNKYVGDDLKAVISNTSFGVNNFPATQAVSGTVTVSTLPDITITNTSFDVSNFPATQAVSGTVAVSTLPAIGITNTGFNVNNFPTTQAVSGTVAVSNTSFDVGNFPTKFDSHIYASKTGNPNSVEILKSDNHQHLLTRLTNDDESKFNTFDVTDSGLNCHITNTVGVSGSVTVNTISGFATETGNLASIKTNTDKINSDTINPDAIQVQIKNASIPVTGSFTVTSCNIKDSDGDIITARPAGSAYVGSLDTYNKIIDDCYMGSGVGIRTNPQLLVTGSSPNIYLNPRCNGVGDQYVTLTTNGAGNTIQFDTTGTKNTVKIDSSAGNNSVVASISTSANTVKIDGTTNTIKVGDGTNTATINTPSNETTKKGVDTNSFIQTYYRTGATNSNLTSVQPIGASSTKALEVYAYNVGLNNVSNLNLPITSTTTDTTQSMDVYLNNVTNTTNNKISNFPTGGNIGLNMYVIPSKTKIFNFNAFTTFTGGNAVIGSNSNTLTYSSYNWGLANPKTWYAKIGGSSATNIALTYTYIDTAGNEQTGTTGNLTTTGVSLGSMITVNSWKANKTLTTNDQIQISADLNSGANAFSGGTYYNTNNSLFTCPNNAIAWVQSLHFYSTSADNLRLLKWDADGNRTVLFGWSNASNFANHATGEYGFGGYITAGETIGWGGENTSTNKIVYSNIVCRYL